MNKPDRRHSSGRACGSKWSLAGGIVLVLFSSTIQAQSSDSVPHLPVLAATLENDEIGESSGLAFSRHSADLLWTHNDSGDMPRLFALDRAGRHRGEYRMAGAQAIDWEDMCSVRIDGQNYLVIGDIGDNAARRDHVTLYWIKEPPIGDSVSGAISEANTGPNSGQVSEPITGRIDFQYEDGPRDCEAVAVDPVHREILLVEKQWRRSDSGVYRLDWPTEPNGSTTPATLPVARRIGQVPLAAVTAMDISADGLRWVVATYAHGRLFERQENEPWPAALARGGQELVLPMRRQGEAICFGPDGCDLWLTSEKVPTPLWKVPWPFPKGP